MTTAVPLPIPREPQLPDAAAQLLQRVTGYRAQAEAGVEHAMLALASLAGWRTVPHWTDPVVVRLALRTAYDRHNPDAGGSRDITAVIGDIEDRWLELDVELQAARR